MAEVMAGKGRGSAAGKLLMAALAAGCLALLALVVIKVAAPVSSGKDASGPAPEPAPILTHHEAVGPPLTFETPAYIRMPTIGVDEEVREGSDNEDELYAVLALGPIHLPHTAFPGQRGNCVISGHRTTYTRPFNRLDELKVGDPIIIDNPRGRYEYVVQSVSAINPAENVTLSTDEPIITLTTCHPEGSASQRLVARGILVNYEERP
jgi:LPXTG-site transpeptidase (sortase) family protein